MSCKHCAAHRTDMLRVWKGMTRFYRARLAEARARKDRREANRLVGLINRFVRKMHQPLPDTCDWRA